MKNCGRKVEDQEAKEMLAEVQGIGTEATRADVIETLRKELMWPRKVRVLYLLIKVEK